MTGHDLLIAAGLDALLGDPRWFPHPVRGMGAVISWFDHRIRCLCRSDQALRIAGICLAVGLPVGVYTAATFLISQACAVSPLLGQAVGIGLAYTALAGRDLFDHVQTVSRELDGENLMGAREAVAMIVGRDSATLTEPEIVRATVETIAESTSDGIIAPLVYLTLGGVPLALAYKAVNTLDSMVGHRDARYVYFGWASARIDDVMNWVPARLTGSFIALAAGVATREWSRVRDGTSCIATETNIPARTAGGRKPRWPARWAFSSAAGIIMTACLRTGCRWVMAHLRSLLIISRRPHASWW